METTNLEAVLLKYGQRVVLEMAKKLKDTTHLKNSLKPVIKKDKDGVSLGIEMPSYAVFVDEGIYPYGDKRPFKDLPKRTWKSGGGQFKTSITKWANSKRIRFNTVTNFSNYPSLSYSSKGFIPNKTRDFLIRRSIIMRGVKPRPFIYLFFEDMSELQSEMAKAAAADYAVSLQIIFNEAGVGVK